MVGVVRGSDPRLSREYVALTSHWDHLGIGTPVNGDSIYNGANDNASGVATILAIARAAASQPRPRRSLLFVFVTAEESGLLGSAFFAQSPTGAAVADRRRPQRGRHQLPGAHARPDRAGREKELARARSSRPCSALRAYASSPDEHPERGYFYRSDHFSFAKAGVPAVSIDAGTDIVGRPKGWGTQQAEDYTEKRYHQPSDEYREGLDLSGAVQLGDIVLRFARQLANAPACADLGSRRRVQALGGAPAVSGSASADSVTGERGLARVIGTWGLAAGIVNVTIGGGIFRLPAGVAEALGAAAPLAYLACAIAMGLIVLCFARGGQPRVADGRPVRLRRDGVRSVRSASSPACCSGCRARWRSRP